MGKTNFMFKHDSILKGISIYIEPSTIIKGDRVMELEPSGLRSMTIDFDATELMRLNLDLPDTLMALAEEIRYQIDQA